MLYNKKNIYNEITKEEFEKNQNFYYNDVSDTVASVVYFYKNKNTNEVIKLTFNSKKNELENFDLVNNELIVKYYVIEIIPDLPIKLDLDDVGISTHIYNIGYFDITNYIDAPKENLNLEQKFKEYDEKFSEMVFPFTDDEFIKENTYRNGLIQEKKYTK